MHIKRPARVLFVLGMVLVLLGAAAGQQAIRRYEQAVLQSADQRLLHTGHTVDQAIAAALEDAFRILSAAADTPQVRYAWERRAAHGLLLRPVRARRDAIPRLPAASRTSLRSSGHTGFPGGGAGLPGR